MANTASAIKRVRSNNRKRLRNRLIRTRTRSVVRGALESIDSGDKAAATGAARTAVRALDKAAQKGNIHKNAAARRKSRLMKKLAKMEAA